MRRRTRAREEPSFFQTPGGWILLWVLGVGLATFLVGYLITAVVFFPGRRAGDVVTVPDLRGMTEVEARRHLDRVDLAMALGTELVHPEVPAGAVLAQSPLPGREVAAGSTVRIFLSAGRDRRPVPAVGNFSAEQAQAMLTRLGFEVEVVEEESVHRAGSVLGVRPPPGTPVELPARVQLVVSSGPPPVEVPDVMELPESAAREVLGAAGLRLGEIDYDFFAIGVPGLIVSQQPAPGQIVPAGSRVHVIIAGSPPLEEIPPEQEPS